MKNVLNEIRNSEHKNMKGPALRLSHLKRAVNNEVNIFPWILERTKIILL